MLVIAKIRFLQHCDFILKTLLYVYLRVVYEEILAVKTDRVSFSQRFPEFKPVAKKRHLRESIPYHECGSTRSFQSRYFRVVSLEYKYLIFCYLN